MNKEAIDALIAKTPKLAGARAKLESMGPGNYCLHRSWGFGKIVDFNEAESKIIIDFEEGKQGHAMAVAFCVDKLDILKPNDMLVRSRTEPDVIEEMIKKQPADLICEILATDEEQAMMATEIERILARVIGPIKYKKWWTATKKLLVKDPRVGVPNKKTEPYILRDEPVKPEEEILELFHGTKNSKEKILLGEKLYALSENISVIREELPEILNELTEAIANAKSLTQADRLHGVWVRNNLARELHEDVEALEPSSASILDATDDYSELASELPAQYYKRYVDLIRRTYEDKWQSMLEDLLRNSSGKFTSECINFMLEHELNERISFCLNRWLNDQTIKGPLLFWVVKNRNSKKYSAIIDPLVSPRLLSAMFYAIDYEALQNASARRIPLADLLSDDDELIPDLLADANVETARDLAQTLLLNQGFEDLTKKSLIARFIKKFPTVQSLIAGDAAESREDEGLVVSQASFDAAKAEYEDLIAKKIPENKEAIVIAREHGDLKENSEYKMARQDQDILLARKNELEVDLSRARVTDFSEATKDNVGIGSVVELKEGSTGKVRRYSILGAWDSDPENDILSYKTPLAQQLLGKSGGDSVTTKIGGSEETWTILSIERYIDVK
ncbi:GreA/GreB family elongation factor [Coraliomargarita akajimensis]|uniref:Transcription elongation factor GreA n=1 Tax=Coraliomargarita akajimensis (strain DSM 45221 / IAM 15411 / JCM 23193 / KCTC 12865 / 04OKA010-24) TaxID=583355 RepID=D5EPB9_CORAD|nr:GreA/GreB family elongation factor [Coraliomargarita akajimensis]ADE55629.1 GreA/GreB family elongation factor [Coraliomargarita akajimensis DSM 45221]